ncbi:MAG TPA: ABC transporter substrate-binding protein [Prolixibacteraceae bacterium]|nr:ABC transporter substrate-binding protein [Prolixibacteraceae bacterium]
MKTFSAKKITGRVIIALLLVSAVYSFQACKQSDDSRKKVLKIYNWSDYIDEDLLKEFPVWYKEQTGEDVKIVYQVFDMPEVMYTKIAMGKEDFDLTCPTQYVIEKMLKNDLLLPIDRNFGKTGSSLENISPFLRGRMDAFSVPGKKAEDFMVPYMWGTSGILYNTAKVSKDDVKSWACLWDPKYKGKILMKDHYWDVYNMAATYGFYDQITSGKRTRYDVSNDHTDDDIAMVEKQLTALRPNLAGWEADFGKEMMTKGEVLMDYAWSGDAVWAIDEGKKVGVSLDYVVPNEGSNIWFDGWVIPKYARNVKAASYFLNYLCQAKIALRNMEVSGYCSAVATPEIIKAQSDSTITETTNLSYFFGPGNGKLHINPIQYPDSSVVDRCVLLHDFMDKNDKVLEMWSRVKGNK